MQQATERKIKELRDKREQDMNSQRIALQNQHSTDMANLRSQQNQIEAERNKKISEYQQMQSNLQQQIQQAHAQINQLNNRPRKFLN